jgi:hypothetical protein
VVDLGLAVQGHQAVKMAAGEDAKEIIIEGNIGRSKPVYRSVISTLFPRAKVSFGSSGGAPFGAAILGAAAVEGKRPEDLGPRFRLDLSEIPKLPIDRVALDSYVDAFVSKAG